MKPYRQVPSLLAFLGWLALPAVVFAAEAVWLEGEDCTSHDYNQHGWYCSTTDLDMRLCSPGEPEVSTGALLGHYHNSAVGATAAFHNVTLEGGDYTWWLRCSTFYSVQSYRIDSSPWLPMNQDGREHLNLMKSGIDIRFLGWIKVCVTNLAAGNHTFAIRIEQSNKPGSTEAHGYIDCMCVVNYDWAPAGSMAPGQDPAPGPTNWWALRAGDDTFSSDSITDMSSLLHKPAGSHGFLQQAGDGFQFGDGTPIKFWACGAAIVSSNLMTQQARFYAKHGINLVRLHPVEGDLGVLLKNGATGDRYIDPVALDRLDGWFAALKQEGVYSTWSLFYPHVITTDDTYPSALYNELPNHGAGKSTSGMVNFMQELQDSQWLFAQKLLTHTNRYTGLAYKDDPALAVVEAHNEDCVFWHAPLNDLANRAGAYPQHSAKLREKWMQWVAAKYTNDVNLAAAWGAGMRGTDSVSNADMDIYGAWEMAAAGPANKNEMQRMGDYIHFLADTQRGFFEQRESRLRGIGFQGVFVTTAWKAGGPGANAANIYCDYAGGAIDRHAYAGGGVGGHGIAVGDVYNHTHLDQPGTRLLAEVFQQAEDKPFTVSEWHMKPPNQWKAEASPLYAFYGMGLHGWDAVYNFTASKPWMRSGWPGLGSYVTETPHYLAQFPALASAIHRGHIKESEPVAARRVTTDQIFRGYDALTRDLPEGGYPGEDNLQTPNEVAAIGRVTMKITDLQETSARTNWNQYWDSTSNLVDSVTGELTWDYGNKYVLVKSPWAQGVVGWAGGRTNVLPDVTVEPITPFCVILFTPVDGLPLRRSAHILVTALARDRQWNAEYNADGTQLLKRGGAPLFMEPVRADITFKGTDITSAKAVDIYGVPTTQDIARSGNTITIDGTYQTYYYEVKREPFPQPQITGITITNGTVSLTCTSLVSETSYAVERSLSLAPPAFIAVSNILVPGHGGRWMESASNSWQHVFYRLRHAP